MTFMPFETASKVLGKLSHLENLSLELFGF